MATVERWLLPDGIEEVLPAEASLVENARRQVLDLFQAWGYAFIVTPHIEFLESLLTGAGQDLALRTFKVTDPHSGRQMGFRADITPQVARLDAHSLRQQGPARFCYAGSVVHAKPRAMTTSRSPIQIGAELYGDASTTADIEVISLMLETLDSVKVPDVHMDLGHVGIYRGLVKAAQLSAVAEEQLFDALQRKAVCEVQELTAGLPAELAEMFNALSNLCGGREVLNTAQAVLRNSSAAVQQALQELVAVADALTERFPSLPLYFDLGELRGYHYHTGVVFAAFVPNVGQSIAQGGRYDDIGAVFGRARPATGFSTDLKTLVSLGTEVTPVELDGVWAPLANDSELWQEILRLRRQGTRVVQALSGQTIDDAAAVNCNQQLVKTSAGWTVQSIN